MEKKHELPDMNSIEYQIGLLRNIETNYLTKRERNTRINVWIVGDILTCFTNSAGSTSAYKHCEFLGINPDGYTFF